LAPQASDPARDRVLESPRVILASRLATLRSSQSRLISDDFAGPHNGRWGGEIARGLTPGALNSSIAPSSRRTVAGSNPEGRASATEPAKAPPRCDYAADSASLKRPPQSPQRANSTKEVIARRLRLRVDRRTVDGNPGDRIQGSPANWSALPRPMKPVSHNENRSDLGRPREPGSPRRRPRRP
jgi:hypothetical protein